MTVERWVVDTRALPPRYLWVPIVWQLVLCSVPGCDAPLGDHEWIDVDVDPLWTRQVACDRHPAGGVR